MDRYIVFIDQDMFYMSIYPDRANHVNIYRGEWKSSMDKITKLMKQCKFTYIPKIPKSLKYAIRQRCQEIRHDVSSNHDKV